MRVIGIDPGTLCCGYGIIETSDELRVKSYELNSKTKISPLANRQSISRLRTPNSELIYVTSGEIRMKNTEALPERLKILYDSLKKTIDEYKPAHLCIERIFYHKNIHSAFALGTARGVVMLLAAQNAIPVFEYNPTELKMALTGYGRAEKRQVKEMVKRILNPNSELQTLNSELTEDAADALALCICHINSSFKLK